MKKNKKTIERGIRFMRVNVFLSILFAIAIVVLFNITSSRIYARWHYDTLIPNGLTSQSLDMLQECQGNVTVISIFEHSHQFRKPAYKLLKELSEASKNIPGLYLQTRSIDANLDITDTAALMKQYSLDINSIIIISGMNYEILNDSDLSGFISNDESNPASSFLGEQLCVLKIHKLLNAETSNIYFLSGHGEFDPTNADKLSGASNIASLLDMYGNKVIKLNIAETGSIPRDCRILIIAGPRTLYSEFELKTISEYLNNGGCAMFLFDNPFINGFIPIFEKIGIKVQPPTAPIQSKKSTVVATIFKEHPITRSLDNMMITFSSPIYFENTYNINREDADRPSFTPLIVAKASESSPSLNVAAAIELSRAGEKGHRRNTRIIICGDSEFISNAVLGNGLTGSKIFVFSAIEWLKGAKPNFSTQPTTYKRLNSGISQNGWASLAIRSAVLLPLAILLIGMFIIAPILRRL